MKVKNINKLNLKPEARKSWGYPDSRAFLFSCVHPLDVKPVRL